MAFKNKIVAKCAVCQEVVPVGTGWSEGPPWVTKCGPCSGRVETAARIMLTLEGNNVAIKPSGYLNSAFSTYRAACEGAKYDGSRNLIAISKAAGILAKLTKAKFIVDVAPEVVKALQAASAQTQLSIQDAVVRADKIDEILKKRGKFLFPFQKVGVSWLAGRSTALVADEMGLGKTIEILAALPDNAAVVVVCPSVAKGVWHREAQAWRPDFKVTILEGRGSFRWPEAGEIIVTNYDILPSVTDKNVNGFATPVLSDELAASCPQGCVIIADEGHALKSATAQRSRKWRGMRDATLAHDGRVWVATATPLLNRAPELWAVLQAAGCANDAFGSFKQFVSLMGGYEGSYGMEWGTIPDPAEIGRRLQRVMLRRLRTEVLPELPVKTYRTINVPVDAKTAKLCDAVLKVLSERGMDLDVIQQTENGADFTEMSRARAALATAKIPALLELIESYEEQEEPLVVFSAHRAPIDSLSTRPGWAVITGDTSPEERTRIENDFQAGKLKGVGATIKAGGVAITLTRSHHAIKVDEEWTPALNAQAEDRICRIGQDRGCIITSLVGDHDLDRRIYELLSKKRTVIEASVEQGRLLPSTQPVVEVAEIDYSKLAAEAQALKDSEAKARAEAEAIAAERARSAEKIREENAKKEQERKEREAAEKKERKARERAMARGWVVEEDHPERRDAQTPREHWAVRALAQLTGDDPDFAAIDNGVGFNKSDAVIGHWMNGEIVNGLTPSQWKIVIRLCTKYQGQVGSPPSETEEEPCNA